MMLSQLECLKLCLDHIKSLLLLFWWFLILKWYFITICLHLSLQILTFIHMLCKGKMLQTVNFKKMNWYVQGDIWEGGKWRYGDWLKIYKQYWNEVILEYSVTSYLCLWIIQTSKHPSIIIWSFAPCHTLIMMSAYHIMMF